MPRRVIIDTDPGIDDAVAILLALAAAELDVQALVAVAGNVPLSAGARNARAVLELAGRPDIPVFAGCPRPLSPGRTDAVHAHGESGLGDLVLPEPAALVQQQHGVSWLVDTLRAAAPGSLTLCAIGPLTNIATVLVMAPDIASAIAELVIMGGGSRGNITPAAEFNVYCDPLAAGIVFDSGVPITLVPLDVTETTIGTPARTNALREVAGSRCAAAAAALILPAKRAPIGLHDPCVVAWLIAPELFQTSDVNIVVETQSPLTMGMTVIDRRGRTGRAANARIVDAIDVDGLYGLLAERLTRLP